MKKNDLVKNWINLQTLPQDSKDANELMWAAEEFTLLALTSPIECWEVILDVIRTTEDEWVLTNLAAGPLENLLAMHSSDAIFWIEEELPKNPKLKSLLQDVWQNLMPESVWLRLQALK